MKVALITGAARGIGAATAAEFAKTGYSLAPVDIDAKDLQKTAARLEHSALGIFRPGTQI